MAHPLNREAQQLVARINKLARRGKGKQAEPHIQILRRMNLSQPRVLAELNDDAKTLYTS